MWDQIHMEDLGWENILTSLLASLWEVGKKLNHACGQPAVHYMMKLTNQLDQCMKITFLSSVENMHEEHKHEKTCFCAKKKLIPWKSVQMDVKKRSMAVKTPWKTWKRFFEKSLIFMCSFSRFSCGFHVMCFPHVFVFTFFTWFSRYVFSHSLFSGFWF